MASGKRLRYNLTSGTLGSSLGVSGTPAGFLLETGLTGGSGTDDEYGNALTVNETNVVATGLRIYYPQTRSVTCRLWRDSDQTLLDSVVISATANTWSTANFSTEVPLTNGATYVVSVGHVSGNVNFRSNTPPSTNGATHLTWVEGRYSTVGAGLFPDTANANTPYGLVDLLAYTGTPNISIDFGASPGFATIGAGEYIPLTVGDSEIVHLTSYTSGNTSGTVERGQEGTTALTHASGAAWVHGPTTQDFDVTELDQYDTLATQSDIAGFLTDGDVGATVYTDAAADPVDGTGAVGDFHLRRDNGTLTGPKVGSAVYRKSNSTVITDNLWGVQKKYAGRFKVGASDINVSEVRFWCASGITSATAAILDTNRNNIVVSGNVSTAPDALNTFPVAETTLTAGTEYLVALRVTGGAGNIGAKANHDWPDADVVKTTLTPRSYGWTNAGASNDWTDTPTTEIDAEYFYFELGLPTGATWTGTDTRVLGDVVQDDLANFLSDGDVTGVVHTDAAADPADGTGEAGDFHLRRDTGTLTGPKLEAAVTARSATGFGSAYAGGMRFWHRWKAGQTLDVTSIGMAINDYVNTDSTVTLYITDASRNILGQTASFSVTAAASANYEYELLSPVSITSGTEYGIGVIATGTIGFAQRTTPLYPDSAMVAPTTAVTMDWNDTGTDFLDAPDESHALDAYTTIESVTGTTWTGANTRVLGDVVQADLAGFLSEQPSGLVHTTAAADPDDGTGTAGDFHLRRDTGLLTGPKIEQGYETLYDNAFKDGTTTNIGNTFEQGVQFTVDDTDVDIIGVRFPALSYDWTGHTVRLWSGASQVRSATISETVGGWAIGYFGTPYAATNGNTYTVSMSRISGRDYLTDDFIDAGSTLVSRVGSVYNTTGGNRPTTSAGDDYGIDPLVTSPNVAAASTWVDADTRVLGDVVQSDIAGFLSEQPSGLVHTTAAADPLDGTGTAGDFHLRRDTGLLTGPKISQTYETLFHNDFQSGGTATLGSNAEAGTVFSIDAADADIIGVRFPTGAYDWTGHTVRLWSGASVVKTATVSVTAGGWAIAYFSTPYAATNGNQYTVSFTRISNRDYVYQPFSDAGSALVTFVNAVYNLTGGNRPTTVVSPDTYGVDPLVDAPGVAEASTWTNADTRVLGDVVQSDIADMATQADIAGFLTEVDGGTVHTDAAADPDDGTGVAGDFHLRSDTGTLTGPKSLAETVLRGADTYDQAGGSGQDRWARRFKKVTSNYTVTHVSVAFASSTAATQAKAYLLDNARNIIAQTDPFACAADALSENIPLLSSVELVAGNHYWVAIKQEVGNDVAFKAGNNAFPDSGITAPDSGDTYAYWNTNSENFTTTPTASGGTVLKYYFELVNIAGSTWTGADTRVLGDVVQADLAGFLSEQPSGLVHTDAAADPVDGTGSPGDFHLRRDTGTLTGPKVVAAQDFGSPSTDTATGGLTFNAFGIMFTPSTNINVWSMKAATYNASSPRDLTMGITDATRTTILAEGTKTGETSGGSAPEEHTVTMAAPYELQSGTQYFLYVAWSSAGRMVSDPASYVGGTAGTTYEATTKANLFTSSDTTSQCSIALVDESGSSWTGADSKLLAYRTLTVQDIATATYVVVAADTGRVKRFTVACTIDLPTGLAVGTVVELMAFHASGITVQAGSGATVHGGGTVAQYKTCSALCVATNTWVVTGAS